MALLTTALIVGFVILTSFANAVGLPAFLIALLPIPITFAGGFVLSRIMRLAGAV